MKKIFENWNKHLLIEGRKDEVIEKYPWMNFPGLLDILVEKDPTKNDRRSQFRYIMWMANRIAATIAPWVVSRITDIPYDEALKNLKKVLKNKEYWPSFKRHAENELVYFHDPGARNMMTYGGDPDAIPKSFYTNIFELLKDFRVYGPYLKNRDIYSYKNHKQLRNAIEAVRPRADAHEHKKSLKNAAKKGGRVIWEYGKIVVIRPLTTEASCLFGKQTKWCISAERTGNAFSQYTEQGQLFYFFLLPEAITPEYKKMAMVWDKSGSGQWDSTFDARDNHVGLDELKEAWNEVKPNNFSEDEWSKTLNKVVRLMERDTRKENEKDI